MVPALNLSCTTKGPVGITSDKQPCTGEWPLAFAPLLPFFLPSFPLSLPPPLLHSVRPSCPSIHPPSILPFSWFYANMVHTTLCFLLVNDSGPGAQILLPPDLLEESGLMVIPHPRPSPQRRAPRTLCTVNMPLLSAHWACRGVATPGCGLQLQKSRKLH